MTAAAFQATYADWRVIKGRKVVQVCFEIPLEAADTAYQVLGGMPIAAKEVWCGIARIVPEAANRKDGEANFNEFSSNRYGGDSSRTDKTTPRPSVVPASAAGADIPPELDRRRKSPAQIAGYLCTLPLFQAFLCERFPVIWEHWRNNTAIDNTLDNVAKYVVREICQVDSRADLTDKNTEWNALQLAFRLWENHPELEDA